MRLKSILSLSKTFLRIIKRVVSKANHTAEAGKALMFVFGGRTQYWFGMGRMLYQQEPVFKKTILKCDELICQLNFRSILDNFESSANEDFYRDEDQVVLTICSIQIALAELWKSRGIFPAATMGVSLGEISAVYAAGGITLQEALMVCASTLVLNRLEQNKYSTIILDTKLEASIPLCKNCPAGLYPVFEAGALHTGVFCHQNDVDIAGAYLTAQKVQWRLAYENSYPYHTSLINKHRQALDELIKKIVHKPLQCSLYAASVGKPYPKHTILSYDYWYNMCRLPVLQYSILDYALTDGFDVFLHVCPQPFLKTQLIKQSGTEKQIHLLDSMREQAPEMEMFNNTHQELVTLKLNTAANHDDIAINFKQDLHLSSPLLVQSPYPTFTYLHSTGSVHFLPAHNSWLVLGYDDVDYILKQPQLFSNSVYQDMDAVLLGADAPLHTVFRNILQPLFSAQAFAELGDYTYITANILAAGLKSRTEFDVVRDFSIPLSQAVISNFLGLSAAEELAMRTFLGESLFNGNYWEQLDQFFTDHLQQRERAEVHDASGLLLSCVKNGQLTFPKAVGLMRLLWAAGMATTSTLISNSVNFLLENPELKEQMRANMHLIPKFIEECLRLEAPESEILRLSTCDVEVAGENIPAGALVLLSLRAANRDPKHFTNPNEFLINRPAKRHLSFGGGVHHCIGMGIARIEARFALQTILEQLPNLKVTAGGPVYFQASHVRSITAFPVLNKELSSANKAYSV